MTTAILGIATLGEMTLGDSAAPSGPLLGSVALDPHMTWNDEHHWSPVRERVQTSVTGKPIVTHKRLQYGRPMTLARADDWMWLSRATVKALESLRDTGGWTGLLSLADGRQFNVRWDHAAGAIEVDPVMLVSDPGDDDRIRCRLHLMEVAK